jgi:hypothetical protein
MMIMMMSRTTNHVTCSGDSTAYVVARFEIPISYGTRSTSKY